MFSVMKSTVTFRIVTVDYITETVPFDYIPYRVLVFSVEGDVLQLSFRYLEVIPGLSCMVEVM